MNVTQQAVVVVVKLYEIWYDEIKLLEKVLMMKENKKIIKSHVDTLLIVSIPILFYLFFALLQVLRVSY